MTIIDIALVLTVATIAWGIVVSVFGAGQELVRFFQWILAHHSHKQVGHSH